jgi:hypothetical protein
MVLFRSMFFYLFQIYVLYEQLSNSQFRIHLDSSFPKVATLNMNRDSLLVSTLPLFIFDVEALGKEMLK